LASLSKLKTICDEFAVFSGLTSNAEKTFMLRIGQLNVISEEISNLGFSICEEFTLLGMKINRELSCLTTYFEEVIITLQRIKEFWERFNLSLPGRISVGKTFMLSQIGYLGCIITPSEDQIKRLQQIIDSFCLTH